MLNRLITDASACVFGQLHTHVVQTDQSCSDFKGNHLLQMHVSKDPAVTETDHQAVSILQGI